MNTRPPKFIRPEDKDAILAKINLEEVVRQHQELKKSGAAYKGICPVCKSDSFTFHPRKGFTKCFKCNTGASGPIAYLQRFFGKTYVDAMIYLAEFVNFDFPDPNTDFTPPPLPANRPSTTHDSSFRDAQLRASGIPDDAQKFELNGATLDRYTGGTLDHTWQPTAGHDMLLHYVSLDDELITFKPNGRGKPIPYIRIRYQNPSIHQDEEGKEIRYRSPKSGGNHLWIPEAIRQAFKARTQLQTLIFVEGEKKADALTLAGLPACGIAGIHNFATNNEMPGEIERLITTCQVQNVVFWFDSDLFNLSIKPGEDIVDRRPQIFAKAAIKYRQYFARYHDEGINIQIYLAHGIDTTTKGADDLLMALSAELTPDHPLNQSFDTAFRSHALYSDHLKLYQITSWSDAQIKELWHLHSPKAFMEAYKEDLKSLPQFAVRGVTYHFNADINDFECLEVLPSDEQFWDYEVLKNGKTSPVFRYLNAVNFLTRRGFSCQRISTKLVRLIHSVDNVIREVSAEDVQKYVFEFIRGIEKYDVLEMLMRGGAQYLGAEKMKNLPYAMPPLVQQKADEQILVFRDSYWKITPDKISVHKHKDLPGYVWTDQVIDFSPTLIEDFITINVDTDGDADITFKADADIVKYILCTSDVAWRTGTYNDSPQWPADDKYKNDDIERLRLMYNHAAEKILAAGYVLSSYKTKSLCKSIVCVDFEENRSYLAQGGTGKSLYGNMFEHVRKMFHLDGKSSKLTEDTFIFDGLDERHDYIHVDDCRRTIDFEFFLSKITHGITANWKGNNKVFVGLKTFIFTTNYSIRGLDASFLRRQFTIAFSDYFNPDRTPAQVLGRQMFDDWDEEQWNYYYNFMASCLQLFMRHSLRKFTSDTEVERRRLRDMIGEAWLDFFETTFYEGSDALNIRHSMDEAIRKFIDENPSQRNYATKAVFKDKAKLFCRYSGYEYNKPREGMKDDRIRNGSSGVNMEYFVLSDHRWDREAYEHSLRTPGDDKPSPF